MGAPRSAIVTTRGHLDALAAASLLRVDTDTKAARVYRELIEEAGGPAVLSGAGAAIRLLDLLALRLGFSEAERPEQVRRAMARARVGLDRAAGHQVGCLGVGDARYPPRLWQIPDPPGVLWFRGRPEAMSRPLVAIVGARQATPAGLMVARRLARELAQAGLAVVSGLARGIDGAAHEGALEADGPTVAVLGSGADVIYPPEHRDLARRICDTGALVSESPPGALPLPWRFPLRNRIISGLARAVVVIEASEKSGSLITAKAALEQGRDVLAVPGSVASGRYKGGHALIKDGARLVETVDDVLEEIGWEPSLETQSSSVVNTRVISYLERIMAPCEAYTLDDLVRLSKRSPPEVLAELAGLELDGRVRRVGGGNFAKT